MSLFEIRDRRVANHGTSRVRASALDRPQTGETGDVYQMQLEGWVTGLDEPVVAVEVVAEGTLVRRVPVDQPRPDVGEVFPALPWAARSGYRTWLSLLGLPTDFTLLLDAVFADGGRSNIAVVQGTRTPLASGFAPTLRPVMVSTMGRAGSTWLMRLLGEHPEVVVHQSHPYELRLARYWWHTLQVLTDPADPHGSAHADSFQTRRGWTGHNPYRPEPIASTPTAAIWAGRTHVEQTAAFCQQSIDDGYRAIATDQGHPSASVFAEKGRADHIPWLVWELYPEAREIFLVRDFRDTISSMLAFNARAGRLAFGPPGATSEEAVVRFIREVPVAMLSQSWPRRQSRAILVRYEDLVADPATELGRILPYLGLDAREETIVGIVGRALRDDPETRAHLTSTTAAASLGRWRTSLSEPLQRLCDDLFGDVLAQFGYDD